MNYSPARAIQLINDVPWNSDELLRIFWLKVSDDSRTKFAESIVSQNTESFIIPIVLREPLFYSANAVLSDVNRLIEQNQQLILELSTSLDYNRVTVLILSNDDFRLPQIGSPIVLPAWFPVKGGREVYFRISDLGIQAETSILKCDEAYIEQMSSLLLDIEVAFVDRIRAIDTENSSMLNAFWRIAYPPPKESIPETFLAISGFDIHISSITDSRAYRPSMKSNTSLLTRLLRIVLRSSPDELAISSRDLAKSFMFSSDTSLKAPISGVLLRPTIKLDVSSMNMHSLFSACYQAYQFTTAAAHASEYPEYSVSLIYATSLDIRRALRDGLLYIRAKPM